MDRVFAFFIIAVSVCLIGLMSIAFMAAFERKDLANACRDAGGTPVNSSGDVLCVKEFMPYSLETTK